MEIYNLFNGELEEEDNEGRKDCWQYRRVGPILGSTLLGATVYKLEPGEFICPYHYEYPNEEWLLVLTGRPTLRNPAGEQEFEAGDVVCFPPGPEGAHQVFNRGNEPLRVVMLSTKHEPAVAVYPDSDKIGVWPGREADSGLFKRSTAVDYWEGE
jgi:uncharacterized cupin superfamily protein